MLILFICHLLYRLEDIARIPSVEIGDVEFGCLGEEDESETEGEIEEIKVKSTAKKSGVLLMKDVADAEKISSDKCCIVYLSPMLTLAKMVQIACQQCGKPAENIETNFDGSALYLKWVS